MSDAIEVLKDLKRQYSDYCNEYQLEDDNKFIDALDEALLALDSVESLKARVTSLSEQKEKFVKILRDINYLMEGKNYIEVISFTNKWIKELEEGVEK